MRKSLFFILLATAAMPALAAGPNDRRGDDSRSDRAERSERGDSEKAQRPERAERTERAKPADNAPAVQRADRSERASERRAERSQPAVRSSDRTTRQSATNYSGRRDRGNQSADRVRPAPVVRDSNGRATDWRSRERRVAATPTVPTTTRSTNSRYGGSYDRDGRDGRRWSSDWRRDGRYNWRNHRNRYSSLYRLGRYHDPFGYGYRRFSIGLFLGAGYYGNNYQLNDPWEYRLPPAYGPYRWVRYYNDALLVNIYDGQVVDVIHNFFW